MSKDKKHHEKPEEKDVIQNEEIVEETENKQAEDEQDNGEEDPLESAELEELKKSNADLEAKLTATCDKLTKTEESYVRLMAEFDTFRRRTTQEKLNMVATAAEDTIKGMLVILDDCERAMKVLSESDDSTAAKEGTELIYNKLMAYLKGKGLTPIEAMGADFNTDEHEAVAKFPVDDPEKKGKVFDVVQTGYKLNGKVIRFAKVVVGI